MACEAVRCGGACPHPGALFTRDLRGRGFRGEHVRMTCGRLESAKEPPHRSVRQARRDSGARPFGEALARLNGMLGDNLTFSIEGTDSRPGARGSLERTCGLESVQMAVLVVARPGGRSTSVTCPVPVSGAHRSSLLSVAVSLAECAMLVGLGTGVYRRGSSRSSAPW